MSVTYCKRGTDALPNWVAQLSAQTISANKQGSLDRKLILPATFGANEICHCLA
jgi:hypothetical protein